MTWQNAIETEKKEERNECETTRNSHYIDGFYFFVLSKLITAENNHFHRGFFFRSLRLGFGFRFCVEIKKIHSIANKGKYKNYFDTKIIA